MFSCVFVTLTCGVQGQVWYLILIDLDPCLLTYFEVVQNVSEYDQELPQSHIADQPKASLGRATEYLQ